MPAHSVGAVMALTPIIYIALPMVVKIPLVLKQICYFKNTRTWNPGKIFTKNPKGIVLDVSNVSPIRLSRE